MTGLTKFGKYDKLISMPTDTRVFIRPYLPWFGRGERFEIVIGPTEEIIESGFQTEDDAIIFSESRGWKVCK